jgi:hypothetical protein
MMPMRRPVALAVAYLIMMSGWVRSAEVYVLRFRTNRNYSDSTCKVVNWRDELLFHNRTNMPKVVVNLATTAGAARPLGQLLIPAGRTISTVAGDALRDLGGDPFGAALLVNQLSVPDGVVVSSRADVFGPPVACGAPPTSTIHSFGSLPLPVVRALAPANEQQIHLTADLGIQQRRTNVVVFNAGAEIGTAHLEFRTGCDDSLLSESFLSVAPGAVIQAQGFTDDPFARSCFGAGLTTDFTRYVVVTVDQPSFSHVMTISNEFAVPTVGVTVSSSP